MFAESLAHFNDNVAVIAVSGQTLSYDELHQEVSLFSKRLNQRPERQLVFLSCFNSLASLVAYLACLCSKHPVLLLDPALSDESKQRLIDSYRPNYMVEASGERPNLVSLSDVTLNLHSDLALLLSTSGSTGTPKQVKLSYNNLQSNANSIAHYLQLSEADRAITSLPMHYSYGLSVINSHLTVGASLVLSDASVVSKEFWAAVKKNCVTSLVGVPYTYEMLYRLRFHTMKLPSLKYMTQAGGKLNKALIIYFAEHLKKQGKLFYVMYGQTEATARMAYVPPDSILNFPESIGVAIPGGSFALEHDDGTVITKANEVGELIYRGPNVMMGYALNAEELAIDTVLDQLKTGDLAKFDEYGFFSIAGRKNRFIKLFGVRVDLGDVEVKLSEKGWISFCVGNDQHLDIVIDNTLWKEPIKRYICDSLRLHHSAVFVHVLETIPRLPNGKVNYGYLSMLVESE